MNQFAMDKSVLRQLQVIKSLQSRTESTVQSLYAQAVMEYSLYYFRKQDITSKIDAALTKRDKEAFIEFSQAYKELIDEHKDGKIITENGYELVLTFE